MSPLLEDIFENLGPDHYTVTSPRERSYNCIAFAAGEMHRWWWPAPFSYWPEGVPREETLQSFILAFESLNFVPCDDGEAESGILKSGALCRSKWRSNSRSQAIAIGCVDQ